MVRPRTDPSLPQERAQFVTTLSRPTIHDARGGPPSSPIQRHDILKDTRHLYVWQGQHRVSDLIEKVRTVEGMHNFEKVVA
jgi:hypothetical protein